MELSLENKQIMDSFTEDNLPGLSTTVLGALELFASQGLPEVKIPEYSRPIIVGSGNAIVTAKMLYGDVDAIFADENNFKEVLSRQPDGAVIFSASGEKHATVIAEHYKSQGLDTTLVTCRSDSSAGKVLGSEKTVVSLKNREPYTYNTSTYMGWVFAKTQEDPSQIWQFILDEVKPIIPENIGDYQGYLLVSPEAFALGNRLFEVKFIELFARRIGKDARTFEEMKHAITVVPYEAELCIQFGEGDTGVLMPDHQLQIPLPENAGLAAIMAIGYYVIGQIQNKKTPWFKENIGAYIDYLNQQNFGKGLSVVVE